jgi:hypothetical protein
VPDTEDDELPDPEAEIPLIITGYVVPFTKPEIVIGDVASEADIQVVPAFKEYS